MSWHDWLAVLIMVFFGGAFGLWVWVMRIGARRQDRRSVRSIRCDLYPDHETHRGEPRSYVVSAGDGDGPDDEAVGFVGFRGPAR